jgi:hypothetical protein
VFIQETPGIVYIVTSVVRSKSKRMMKRRENFYGKAKNQNQVEGV